MAGAFSDNNRRILEAVGAAASGLSFIGSSFIVLCYILFKELRKFSFKLVFFLALSALSRWGYYPLILIGSWAFGTINRIHDFIDPKHRIFWLSLLDVGMASLMGLFNSIAYGLNASVRRAILERLDQCWPDKFRKVLSATIRLRGQQQENELIPLRVHNQP